MLLDAVLTAYGITRPPPPSAEREAQRLLCNPAVLCAERPGEAVSPEDGVPKAGASGQTCARFEDCRAAVTRVATTDGADRQLPHSTDLQRKMFVAHHFDLLNPTAVDRVVSQKQAIHAIVAAIPPWAAAGAAVVFTIVFLTALLPAFVICVQLLRNRVALAKLVVLVLFTLVLLAGYAIAPT